MTMTIPAHGQVLSWLGGSINVRVEIDTGQAGASFGLWGVGTWGESTWGSADAAWTNISGFCEDIQTRQGIERWGGRFETGSMTVLLDNRDGRFTPESGFMPFHLPFRPGRRIRLVAVPDLTDPTDKKVLWIGVIDSITPSFAEGGYEAMVAINCLDFMYLWGKHNPTALETPTGVQDTDERVAAALDRMDWPDDAASRDIQTGVHTMQSSHLAQSTLEECGRAADAEGGAFFCSPDGKATFKARDWLSTDARSTEVQGYLGYDTVPDGANTAHVESASISPTWEMARVVNLVEFARVGSTMQMVEDETSQALFGIQSYQRTDLENNTDAEVLFLATRYLGQFSTDRMRIDSITISANADPDNEDLNRLMWDSRFGDLLNVRVPVPPNDKSPEGWELEKLVKVMGISHRVTAESWEVTFFLDDVFVFAGGSALPITITFEGGGESNLREGGSDMAPLSITFEGGGASTLLSGGSDMAPLEITFEGGGHKSRAGLMGLLAPEAWWRFNTSSPFADHSGNGRDLAILGASTGGGAAFTGDQSMSFDGTNDYAELDDQAGDEPALRLRQDMSIEFWVRPHDASGDDQAIISMRHSTSGTLYHVYYSPTFNVFDFYPTSSSGSGGGVTLGGADPNEWTHVVITIDWSGANRIITAYQDGVLHFGPTAFAYQPPSAAYTLNIGRRANVGDDYFDGNISEIAIFDRVLTTDEVAELYESTYG